MAIRIGIYDFFAYTIPGGLMILLGLAGVYCWVWPEVWTIVLTLNTLGVFLGIIAAYLTGLIMEPVFAKWGEIYTKKDFRADLIANIQKRNPALNISLNPAEWAIWFASIRRESLDLSLEIDRWMAVAKMLRGVSFALLLGGLLCIFAILSGRISWAWLPTSLLLFALAFLAVKQSLRFRASFFLVIFETIIARQEPFSLGTKFEKNQSTNLTKKED